MLHEGVENCLNYLKRGWNIQEGRGNNDFKKEGKLGQGFGTLKRKRWGLEPPYELSKDFEDFLFQL